MSMAKAMAKNDFCIKKGIFSDQSDVIKRLFCFPRMRTSQTFDFICESLSISLCRSLFFFAFIVQQQFFCPLYRFFLHGIVAGQLLRKGTNLIFKEQSGKQRNWQWIVPQNVTFFCECNVVRISQNIQNEVSLEIFADVVAYQFINLN